MDAISGVFESPWVLAGLTETDSKEEAIAKVIAALLREEDDFHKLLLKTHIRVLQGELKDYKIELKSVREPPLRLYPPGSPLDFDFKTIATLIEIPFVIDDVSS